MKKILSSILFLIICTAVEAQTCSAPIALNIVNGNTYRFWTDSIVGIQSYAWIVTTFEDDTATSSGSYSSTSSAYFAGSTFNSPDYVQVCLTLTFVDGCVSSNCDTFPYCDAGFTYALNEQYGLTLTADFPAAYMNELHYWTVNGPGIPNPTQNTEIPTYYVTPGATYNICQQLMITSSGCNTTECQDITIPDTIVPVCDAAFTYYYQPTNAYLNVSSPYAYGQGSFEHNWLVTSYMSDGTVNANNQLNVNNNSLFVAANTSALEICHTLTNLNTGCVDSSCQYLDFCTAEYTHVIDTANQVLTLTAGGIQTLASHSWNVTYHAIGGVYDSEILNGPIATFFLPEGILDMTICHVVNNTFPGSTCSTYACDTIVFCNAEFTVIDNGNGTAGIWAVSPPTPGAVYTWSITGPGYNGAAYSGSYFNFTPVPNEPYYVCMAYFNGETGCVANYCDTIVNVGFVDSCSAELTTGNGSNGWPEFNVNGGGLIASYNWNMVTYNSNGTALEFFNSIQSNASIPAGTAYSYIVVSLAITFETGCQWSGGLIHTGQPDSSITCDASIQYSYVGDVPNPSMFPYQFYSAYSGDIAEVIHSWVTSDAQTSSSYSPLFGFAPGTYTVCHSVSDINGLCSDSTCISITVVPDSSNTLPCNAEFYHNGPILLNNMYQFTGVPNNGNAYHLWTFGDGASSEQEYPFHDFDTTGVFTVCHIVGVDGVCADTICNTIQVTEDTACNVDIVVSYATDGWPVFSAIGGSEIATYNWILSPYDSNGIGYNGTYFYSTQSNAYVPAGTEYVGIEGCVSVTFTNGCAWNGCANFTAPPDTANFLPCNAQFSYTGPLQPDSYQFTGVMNDSDAYHEWTFGDGTSSNLAMPIHSYASPGNYEVCHIVGIDGVCADTVCSTIYFGLYLAGTVNVGANCIDFGSVKLYSLDTVSNSVELIGQYPMDNNLCFYNFIGLTPGIYLVRAGLSDSSSYYNDYVPTYFGSQYYWFDAEPIYLTQSGDFYNISLIYGSNPGGNGTVNGSIDDGPFRLSNPELSSSMSPVLGAQVVITDLANVPQRWVRTDNSGAFSITDLAYGTYRLMADEPGMTCLPIEFTLSEQTPGVTIDLVMGDEITGIVSYETSFVQGDVYPNPSNSLANLNIELIKPASMTMTITSITGQVIWTQTNSFMQGKSFIQIPVRGIADGLYFLSIYSEKGQLITSRKMQVAN